MHYAARIALSICVLISAVAAASSGSAKLRRDGVLNLYPFPRVGRAHHTWQVPINDEYLEPELASKRQLYAFPRVGRADFANADWYQPNLNSLNLRLEDMLLGQPRNQEYVKRESEGSGMWFGPRIGRSLNYDDVSSHNEAEERSDPEETEVERIERKKRQTTQA